MWLSMASERRFAVVTGAYGAIGSAIAEGLARAGFEVALVGRDAARLGATTKAIAKAVAGAKLHALVADLGRRESLSAIARNWHEPLHVLVNNAATAPSTRQLTPEGLEVQWATNVLGYLWMTEAFADALARAAPSRIVNVASYWAGDLDVSDPMFERRRYSAGTAYRQSKQCNRMLSSAWSERLLGRSICVNACHSGDVDSKLSNSLGFGGHETPEQGASTPLRLATDPRLAGVTGKYFEHGREAPCRFSADRARVEELAHVCDRWMR